jgi:hypothetical protein
VISWVGLLTYEVTNMGSGISPKDGVSILTDKFEEAIKRFDILDFSDGLEFCVGGSWCIDYVP